LKASAVASYLSIVTTHLCPLDSWSGIDHGAVEAHRQGYDLQPTQYDDRGWRATFYTTGMEYSPTSATGTGWECTPWRAARPAGVGSGQYIGVSAVGLRLQRAPLLIPEFVAIAVKAKLPLRSSAGRPRS